MVSLCQTCGQMREVISGRGSRFFLCRLAQTDRRYPKYPPQPVVRCAGYQAAPPERSDASGHSQAER